MTVAIALLTTPGREEVETLLNVHAVAASLVPRGVLGRRARALGIGNCEVGQSKRNVESTFPDSRSTVHCLDDVLPGTLAGVELASVCTISRHTNKSNLARRGTALRLSDGVLQIRDRAPATGLIALALGKAEHVRKVHSAQRLRALPHSSMDWMIRVRIKSQTVGIAAGGLISLVHATLQLLMGESLLAIQNVRVSPDDHVLLPMLGLARVGVQPVPSAKVVVRRLNVMTVPVDGESALEQRRLAVPRDQNARPAGLAPSVLLHVHALDERPALEDLVLHPVHLLGMPYAAVGGQVGDAGAIADDVVVRFEFELDVEFISDVECQVEVGKGVDAMVARLDSGVVDLGDG